MKTASVSELKDRLSAHLEVVKAATPGLFELPPEQALEKAMLGLALFEPILVAFRRLAHERIVLEVLAPEASPPARR